VSKKLTEKLKNAFSVKSDDAEQEETLPGKGKKISRRTMLKFFGMQMAAGSQGNHAGRTA